MNSKFTEQMDAPMRVPSARNFPPSGRVDATNIGKSNPALVAATNTTNTALPKSSLLSRAWRQARDKLLIPQLRQVYVDKYNQEYEPESMRYFILLTSLDSWPMCEAAASSVKELLQVAVLHEQSRRRAVARALKDVLTTDSPCQIIRHTEILKDEAYRVAMGRHELKYRHLQPSTAPWTIPLTVFGQREQIKSLGRFFVRMQRRNTALLEDIPNHPAVLDAVTGAHRVRPSQNGMSNQQTR